jgi:DNA replication licensing factor MCM4
MRDILTPYYYISLNQRRGNRMAVRDVVRQLSEVTNTDVSQEEIVEALRRMEADGVVQFNERAQSIFVRVGIVA